MEQLSIASFLACNHDFHLYSYEPVQGVPSGAVLRDGNEILPASAFFDYTSGFGQNSNTAFSNFFRYKLLLDGGGWWVDTDVVCLRHLDLSDERVLATETTNAIGESMVASAVIKAPKGCELVAWVWQACQQMDVSQIKWGDIGPDLMQKAVETLGFHRFLKPATMFCPVSYFEWRALLDPSRDFHFDRNVYTVHLWNQMWRSEGASTDATYDEGCLYEILKRRYL